MTTEQRKKNCSTLNDLCNTVKDLDDRLVSEHTDRVNTELQLQSDFDSKVTQNTNQLRNEFSQEIEAVNNNIKTEVNKAIASVVDEAPESFDTLKEAADWIQAHGTEAAAMQSAITNLENNLTQEALDRTTQLNNKVDKDLSNATGTLSISNGGTGATTANGARNNLLSNVSEETSTLGDDSLFAMKYTNPSDTNGAVYTRKASLIWEYIKGKIGTVLGLTSSNYGGTSAKATSDENGVNIASNYARKPNTYQNPYQYVDNKSYFYWYKILDGATLIGDSGRQVKLKVYNLSDTNYPYRAEFTVDVTSYLNGTSKNISVNLINHYMTNENHGNLCVAIDSDFNVYFQTNCLWGSHFSVETIIAVGITPTQTKLNYAALYQDPTDFVSVKKITDTGKFRMSKDRSTGAITFSQEYDNIAKITATKATADKNGNDIVDTYATKTVATTSANGLMSASDKSKLDTLVPVGTIFGGVYSTAPTGYLLCNGATYSISTYSELYKILGTNVLPDLRGKFLQGANGNLKQSIEAGLPNITGELEAQSYTDKYSATGAFSTVQRGHIDSGSSSASTYQRKVDFDARRSSKIYGNSDTVQPPAYTVNYIIKY